MTPTVAEETVERLKEIRYEMSELLAEAHNLVRSCNVEHITGRWKGYVHGHIQPLLEEHSEYLSHPMSTMSSVISDLECWMEDPEQSEENTN